MSLSDQQWCPTSVQVTVLQARGLRTKGKSGTNDAYAVMQVGKEKYQTSVVEKSVAPVWKEEASFDLPPLLLQGGGGKVRGSLHVQVLHRALVGPDKLLGQAVINLLQLSEDKTRNKTEWFKLLDKTGKADKDRGEVLLDIQFMRNNMTASMFDLSAAGKSRSRLGKLKDKVRGKKKELDSSSGVVPSLTQVLTDSEEEDASGGGEGGASKDGKSKQHKRMSLFSPKSNLQRNMSQSMSVLPAKNSSLSGSQSSGLNVDSSEGKKKFKFKIHKHSSSSDSKDSSSGQQKQEPSSLCINGSHVYCEEPPPRTSRTGSSFSLSSSGRGSMEDVPDNSSPSVNSLKAVKEHSSWMEEEEEEEDENIEDLRKEEEKAKLEKDIRREEKEDAIGKQQGKLERLAEEKLRRDEEEKVRKQQEEHQRLEERRRLEEQERRKLEEEKRCREEEERIKKAEEERAQERRQEEERKLAVEKSRLKEEEEKVRREQERAEEQRKKEQAEKRQREEEMRIEEEKKASREKEHARREEEKRIEAEEKYRKAEEERIKMEEERKRKEHEEKLAKRKELEEKEMRKEQEKMQREEEERKKKVEEERRKVEEDRARRENEERIQKEKIRREEEEKKKTEEEERKRKQEELERLAKEKLKQEEEERRKVEEERARREEEEDKIQKEKIREEEERKKKEERKIRQDELERLAREKLRQEEEERRKVEEEQARREEDRIQEEKIREEEKAKKKMEEEMREEKRKEEEERIKNEEQKTFKKEEEKGKREEKERIEEKWRAEELEKQRIEEEKVRRQEEERIQREEKAEKERREDEERKQERLTKEKKENKIKEEQKSVGTKLRLRVPAECTSTNPFDESFSPEETHTSSKATTDDQRNPSAVSSEERGAVFTNDRHPINAQRDKRVAPKPPGRNQPERSLTITPLNRSSKDLKNNESTMENDSTKEATTKHNKRPAPAIPCTAEDELHRDVLEMKEDRASYSLNPFEDDDENDLTVHNDATNSGKTDPVSWPAVKSQTAEKDATKIKSSKMARAPLPPAQNDTPSSSMISQNLEESKVSDIRVAAPNKACNPQEVKSRVQFQESPNKESKQIVTVAGVKEGGPPAGSRRLQPVKPLNPLEQQSDSVKVGNDNKATGLDCNGVQHKTNAGTGRAGPYSQLTREELIALLLKQENQLSERDKKISELERYIDNLLVRVIEEKPSILMSMSSLKKAA
ncbi:hypothetical protein ATANTOWER_031810 [Ataeniobius toweri]|uniref:Rab11 family-interacting protein 1-like n=1 Tax=Ataeniobius toweri TaxID=208326 RepID=A0ABU7A457_9TELE|nr:hypothetical protein [Ataeniobius toweri]